MRRLSSFILLLLFFSNISFSFPWSKEKRVFFTFTEVSREDGSGKGILEHRNTLDDVYYLCDIKETYLSFIIDSTLVSNGRLAETKKTVCIAYTGDYWIEVEQVGGMKDLYMDTEKSISYHYYEIPYSDCKNVMIFSLSPKLKREGRVKFMVVIYEGDNNKDVVDYATVVFLPQKKFEELKK